MLMRAQQSHPIKFSRVVGAPAMAFTLMELMVSISILIIIILSVGVMFSGASKTVSGSQGLMDVMSSVRATQGLIERDIAGLDKNAYIVIRQRIQTPAFGDKSLRCDQISFISNGSFPNRTGANSNSPFTDGTIANAAHIWWGQLIMEKNNGDASYMAPNQTAATPAGRLPTGFDPVSGAVINEGEAVLGRRANLLMPGPASAGTIVSNGQPLMAYSSPSVAEATITGNDTVPAHISSSRYDVIAQSPAQLMQAISAYRTANPGTTPEADLLTYRARALASVYDTEVLANPFVNGYFRTHPVVMQGVSSFKIEWTDGRTYQSGDGDNPDPSLYGQLRWYSAPGGVYHEPINFSINFVKTPDPNDYVVTFSYYNRPYWPKALRFTMHVASDRLSGGRDFVQVVYLPK